MSHHFVEYREAAGRQIRRLQFSSNPEWKCVTIDFTDDTQIAFKFDVTLEAEVEMCLRRNGDLQDFVDLEGVPIKPKVAEQEG